jgi:PAS domain S-box-containing protein
VAECKIYQSFRSAKCSHHDDDVFWRADGTGFPVEYWCYPIFQEGKAIGSVVTFIDITKRKPAEQERASLAQRVEKRTAELSGPRKPLN